MQKQKKPQLEEKKKTENYMYVSGKPECGVLSNKVGDYWVLKTTTSQGIQQNMSLVSAPQLSSYVAKKDKGVIINYRS